jgi:DNA-binding NtrC family response regulator
MVTTAPNVLVIDGLSETATVLEAVLSRRGTTVQQARDVRRAAEEFPGGDPAVVVIDGDDGPATTVARNEWPASRQVVITSARLPLDKPHAHFLQKPFQFPELVRLVEDLLAAPPRAA